MTVAGNCSCGSMNAPQCGTPLLLNNNTLAVSGMFIGCLPLSSLLRSSLSCFYNDTCLTQVLVALKLTMVAPDLQVSVLNSTIGSRFKPDTSLESILNALLVETWTLVIDYSAYFKQCDTTTCTYLLTERKHPLNTLSKLLGLCEYYYSLSLIRCTTFYVVGA